MAATMQNAEARKGRNHDQVGENDLFFQIVLGSVVALVGGK